MKNWIIGKGMNVGEYECSYCGTDCISDKYLDLDGKCECGGRMIRSRGSDGYAYHGLNCVDDILEDKRSGRY